jgi:serine protease Do
VRGLKGLAWFTSLTLGFVLKAQAGVTPELQHAIRDETFEVVMKKPEKDPVSYEKALPLDLLPFYERNDAYRSVGTAFALGHNTYVTAAHVLVAGIGSQFGMPSLRRADGTVLAIDRILKFSLHEDFVVFSLRSDPGLTGFAVNREPKIDEPVLAVGNALGEGIVIRDGLFTSETPEDQDGRWKWIRFSAAASPGNSGGPLLDGNGKVIGIVIGKSPNENLNFSLPIGRLLDGEDLKARFDQRVLIRLPYLHGTYTYSYKDQFGLPLTWPAFVEAYKSVIDRHNDEGRAGLLKTYAATLFPKGPGTEDLFFEPDLNEFRPRLIAQQADGRWTALKPEYRVVALPGDGSVSVANAEGAALLRLVRPNQAADDAFYRDSKAFMDLALKALDLRRAVGPDQVRVTSLGSAQTDTVFVDAFGRKWQKRIWAVPFLDVYLVGLLLPVPDGYAAIIEYAPSQFLREVENQAQLLTGQMDVSYRGTLAQWLTSLQRRELLPEALAAVKLDRTSPWTLQTRRLIAHVPREVLSLTDKSPLSLVMGFMNDGKSTVWDIQEVWWSQDDREDAAVGLWRRARPPGDAKLELRNKFTSMRDRRSPYDGAISRDTTEIYSVTDIRSAAGRNDRSVSSDLLYGLTVRMTGHPTVQGATESIHSFEGATRILEPGFDQDMAARPPSRAAMDEALDTLEQETLAAAAPAERIAGKDIRGRLLGEDLNDYFVELKKEMSTIPAGRAPDAITWTNTQKERLQSLQNYWNLYPALSHNRDVWKDFLARNHLSATTPHAAAVVEAEGTLLAALKSKIPTKEWAELGRTVLYTYVWERRNLVRSNRLTPDHYQSRVSPCSTPAIKTSGTRSVRLSRSPRSAEEFWPVESKRLGEEGLVIVSLKISATGCATAASIAASSGFDALDDAVLQFYETLEFFPGEVDGKAIESAVSLPVDFKLTG